MLYHILQRISYIASITVHVIYCILHYTQYATCYIYIVTLYLVYSKEHVMYDMLYSVVHNLLYVMQYGLYSTCYRVCITSSSIYIYSMYVCVYNIPLSLSIYIYREREICIALPRCPCFGNWQGRQDAVISGSREAAESARPSWTEQGEDIVYNI